jgi:hypothetical protein
MCLDMIRHLEATAHVKNWSKRKQVSFVRRRGVSLSDRLLPNFGFEGSCYCNGISIVENPVR